MADKRKVKWIYGDFEEFERVIVELNGCTYTRIVYGSNQGLYITVLGKKYFKKDVDFSNGNISLKDKIRQASDKELAEILCDLQRGACRSCPASQYCKAGYTGFIDYLEKEVE